MSVYLDNAATSYPKPEEVYRAVTATMTEVGVAPGRGEHRQGMAASRLVFEAREALASLFSVPDSSRIIFTHSATEALNLAVSILRPGDHAVCTTMEHNSLLRPLHRLAGTGVAVTLVPGDRSGLVSPSDIAAALRPETRLVAISHCSNVTGTIQPVAEIGKLARDRGALFLVDAAQSAGNLAVDVEAMQVDLLAAPGHKGLLGPQGTGFLYVREGVELAPLLVGGSGGYSDGFEQPEAMPERLESGTLNTPGIAGLRAGIGFILETGIDNIRKKESRLMEILLDGLSGMPEISIIGPRRVEERGSVLSFVVAHRDPAEIGFLLDRDFDITVRTGLHCAFSAHKTVGTYPSGTVRVSPGWFNTEKEMEYLLQSLQNILAGSSR